LGAVELASFLVLVVDVPLQVRNCTKAPLAPCKVARKWAVMISPVMTRIGVSVALGGWKSIPLT
jgi:hypothetical protein